MSSKDNSTIQAAADRLRAISLSLAEGDLIGNEDALTARINVSVSSIRQAARLVEREGLLVVKRGRNGGYFAARPGERTAAAIVAQLDVGRILPQEIGIVAKPIWEAAISEAARQTEEQRIKTARPLVARVAALRADAAFAELRVIDKAVRAAIFGLSGLRYLELIYNINTVFAGRAFPGEMDAGPAGLQTEFVRDWRAATMLQLEAVLAGDPELACFAADRLGRVMTRRVQQT